MSAQENLIDQLEDALASKSLSRRADVLKRITDLFVSGSGSFSADQIDLFDDVMSKLIQTIETSARATFGSRLATVADAPINVIRLLAFDHAIEVAAPVLSQSERLGEDMLVENANTMSQDHLLAISKRKSLNERVTDVLIDRGNHAVVTSTAANEGSRFSPKGFSSLVDKSRDNNVLALCVFARPDIPRQELVRLFQEASDGVRKRLEAAQPRKAQLIRAAVAAASDQIQRKARVGSVEHQEANVYVRQLHIAGKLDEDSLRAFADAKNFDRTAVAISILCELPIGLVERALAEGRFEQILVFAKATEFSWNTTRALLLLQSARRGITKAELEQYFTSYSRLQIKTARTALQFYRLREQGAGQSDPN